MIAFTAGEAYKEYLQKRLDEFSDKTGNHLIFHIRANDTIAQNAIQTAFPNAAVETDPSIEIGSFKVVDCDNSVLIDESLDSGLENQLDWFLLNSNLKVDV